MLSYFKGRAFDPSIGLRGRRLRHLSFYSLRTLSLWLLSTAEASKGRFMAAKVWKLYQSPKSFFMAFERASLWSVKKMVYWRRYCSEQYQ